MKSSLYLLTFSYCVVCGKGTSLFFPLLFGDNKATPKNIWDPTKLIDNVVRPVIEGHKEGASHFLSGVEDALKGNFESAIQHQGYAVEKVIEGHGKGLQNFVKNTQMVLLGVPPLSTKPEKTKEIEGNAQLSTVIEIGDDNEEKASITKVDNKAPSFENETNNINNTEIKSRSNSPDGNIRTRQGDVKNSAMSVVDLGQVLGASIFGSIRIISKATNNSPITQTVNKGLENDTE